MKSLSLSQIVVLAGIAIIPLVYSTQTIDPAFTLRAILLAALTLVTIFASWKQPVRTSPVLWVWFAFAGFNIASIIVAQNSGEAIYQASMVLLYGVWLFSAMQIVTKDFRPTILKTIALIGFVMSLISLFQYFDLGLQFIPSWGIPGATMTTKNLMSSFLFLTLPATLYVTIVESKQWSIFGLVVLTMCVFVLLVAQTRAVWVASGASLLMALIIFTFAAQRKQLWNNYRKKLLHVAIAVATCLVAIFVIQLAPQSGVHETTTSERVGTIVNYSSDASAQARLNAWKKSIEMFQDHPLLGVGAGNWKIELPHYGLSVFLPNIQDGSIQWTHAHNDFIEVLCETGIGGALAFLSVFLIAIFLAIRSVRKTTNNSRESILATLISASIFGFGIISFFDFPNSRVEHSMLLMLWLAMIPTVPQKNDAQNNYIRYMAVILLLPGFLLSIKHFLAEQHEKTLLEARIDQNWNGVISEFPHSYDPRFITVDALSTPLLYYKAEAEFMQQDYNAALRDNLEALKADPNHFFTLNNTGSCYVNLGNLSMGKVFYRRALAISPNFEEALLNLAAVYFNQKQLDSAYECVRKCDTSQDGSRAQKYARALWGVDR